MENSIHMETLVRLFWSILLFSGFSPWICGKLIPEDFEEKLMALYRVIDYINRRPNQMNADVTFSITIVQANVAAVLLHENSRNLEERHITILESILSLSELTREELLKTIVSQNKDIQLLHQTLNHPILWLKNISWRYGNFDETRHTHKLIDEDIKSLLLQGTPKEVESDRCLANIVRNGLNGNHKIPDLCLSILKSPGIVRGYPLTHRLLITSVVKTFKLDDNFPSMELISFYCSAILRDLIAIEAAGFPYQTSDLMMEQVVLCGMQGFLEFTGSRYEQLILRWSQPIGCFNPFRHTRIYRRASRQTDYGCDSHATGLSAAALSLFIRKNVELNDYHEYTL